MSIISRIMERNVIWNIIELGGQVRRVSRPSRDYRKRIDKKTGELYCFVVYRDGEREEYLCDRPTWEGIPGETARMIDDWLRCCRPAPRSRPLPRN